MTRNQAIRKLQGLFGTRAYWRVGSSVTSPEKREEAKNAAAQLKADMEALDAEIRERERTSGITELRQRKNALYRERERQNGLAHHYKFTVGINKGWCVEHVAEGDTWEEAIDSAERKQSESPGRGRFAS